MNNRIEAKLTDLSGFNKAINEVLQNAWERGRRYGQAEMSIPIGKWIKNSDGIYFCENCREDAEWLDGGSQLLSNFCPDCGAKMEKSQTQKFADNDTAYGGLASAT